MCSDNGLPGRWNLLSWLLWHFVSLFLLSSKKKWWIPILLVSTDDRTMADKRNSLSAYSQSSVADPEFPGQGPQIRAVGCPSRKVGHQAIFKPFFSGKLHENDENERGWVRIPQVQPLDRPMILIEIIFEGDIHQLHWPMEGIRVATPPVQFVFIFVQFSREKWLNNSLVPTFWGWHPVWEILDPPLNCMIERTNKE